MTSPEAANLRGKAVLTFDGAGVVETASFDFKGNALSWSRRLATAITAEPDWTPTDGESTPSAALTAAASLLENETWTKAFAYDALNRVTSATMPDSSELLPSYNEAGLLDGVEVKVRGASTATAFVDDIDYDAHGRRTRIEYGNGTATQYLYDEQTFRLRRIQTTRSGDSKVLQDLKYTYDPVGNIVEVRDDAHEDVFFNDAQRIFLRFAPIGGGAAPEVPGEMARLSRSGTIIDIVQADRVSPRHIQEAMSALGGRGEIVRVRDFAYSRKEFTGSTPLPAQQVRIRVR